jgi:tRNA uridine 5-carboxymethylaminomethyl modification enzyme
MAALDAARSLAAGLSLTPNEAAKHGIKLNQDGVRRNVFDLLAYPDMSLARLSALWPELGRFDRFVAEQIETEAHYAVYLERQAEDAERFRRDDAMPLPVLDYAAIAGLSNELREKLARARPSTIGQAARIDGMTPAAIMLLLTEVRRTGKRPAA